MKEEITLKEIDRLAELSGLSFSQQEKEKLLGEVNGIVNMLNKCDQVETIDAKIDDAIAISELRDDVVQESLDLKDTFLNTQNQKKNYFVVPKVVD